MYRTRQCPDPWLVQAVDWDGNVLPCCLDLEGRNRLGRVGERSLRELWRASVVRDLRRALRTRRRDVIDADTRCRRCSYLCDAATARYWNASFFGEACDELRRGWRDP